MIRDPSIPLESEETPVDDVRRIRERLSREVDQDIERLVRLARAAASDYEHGATSGPPDSKGTGAASS